MKYFIAYLLLEIAGFALVGKYCGVLITVGAVVLTTLLGFWLMRRGGGMMNMETMQQMQRGQIPAHLPNGFQMLAAMLLILPGFLTDLLGLLLLFPFVQSWVSRYLAKKGVMPPQQATTTEHVIEGEVTKSSTDLHDQHQD